MMKSVSLTFKFHMERLDLIKKVEKAFLVNPIVAILGPRQVGKTTLALQYAKKLPNSPTRFDLEDITDLSRLETPKLALQDLKGLIIIDEIQRCPDLFPTLRVLVDRKLNQQYLILGSASPHLLKQTSESLTGRISYLELTPFNLREVKNAKKLWLRGGFPKSYLAASDEISFAWRRDYVNTFLERDVPSLGFQTSPAMLRRFWMMLAHYHGQNFNASALGQSLGVAHTTIKHYLDILTGTFMIRELQPWFENIGKRQIKTPKIYFRDSGIFHFLLGIDNIEKLNTHPKLGASWEGFILEQIINFHQAYPEECFFWGIHNQAELDLFILKKGQRLGFEIKYTDRPKLTRSMQIAIDSLNLDQLNIIIPGDYNFPLSEKVQVIGSDFYFAIGRENEGNW